MRVWIAAAAAMVLCAAAHAADTKFDHTHKVEGVGEINYKGRKVAAVVIGAGVTGPRRINAENVLAKYLTGRGMQGVAGHSIVPLATPEPMTRERAIAMLQKAGVAGVVVLKLVNTEKKTVPTQWASTEFQQGLVSRNYMGPVGLEGDTYDRAVTTVTIETMLFSLEPYKLLWAGQSETVNPKQIDVALPRFANAVAAQLQREGLVK